MPELAHRNMYGYRQLGPEARIRVQVRAGKPIPPDVVDLEDAPERERAYATLPPTSVAAATATDYGELTKNDLVAHAESRGIEASGTKDDIVERLEAADAGS